MGFFKKDKPTQQEVVVPEVTPPKKEKKFAGGYSVDGGSSMLGSSGARSTFLTGVS